MIFLLEIIILIFSVVPLQQAFHIIIPYMLKINKGKMYYVYDGKSYPKRETMFRNIVKDNPSAKNGDLLLELVETLSGKTRKKVKGDSKYEQLRGMLLTEYIATTDEILVHKVKIGRHWMYQCNGNVLQNLEFAVKCETELKYYSKTQIPQSLLGTNSFSNKIWTKVWFGCGYKCYSYNNFVKMKFANEINFYRKEHGSRVLVSNPNLNHLAQGLSEKLATLQLIKEDDPKSHNQIAGSVSIVTSSLKVKRWYDEHKKFNPNMKNHNVLKNFNTLLWKKNRKIGIGITKKENKLYIVIRFS